MRWRWRLGKLMGIEIYMHVTFPLLLGWVALSYIMEGLGPAEALEGVAFVLLLFACVVAHEYGHALTARRYGIRTQDITLLPIGGLARLERMPRDPAQEFWVALAGPAVNVVLAAALFLGIFLLQGRVAPAEVQVVGGDLPSKLMWANVTLVAFNLLPAFPMDGGRLLRALLARRTDYARATRIAAHVGQVMAIVFGFIGLFSNPFLLLIALFVYMGAEAEAQSALAQVTFQGLPVRDVMVTRFVTLSAEEPLRRAMELLLSGNQQDFPVLQDGKVVGQLGRRELVAALQSHGAETRIAGAMRADVVPVEASAPLEETFQRMQAGELSAIPVTENGRLVGMITMENIAEFLMIRTAMRGAGPQAGRVTGQRA